MVDFKKLFQTWPHRFSTVFVVLGFLLNYRFRNEQGVFKNLIPVILVIIILGLTVYFLRNFTKKTFKFSVKRMTLSKNLEETDLDDQNHIEDFAKFLRKSSFVLIWFFVPISISLSIIFIVRSVSDAVIGPNYKLALSAIIGFLFGLYFKIAEKTSNEKSSLSSENEHTILTIISVFGLFSSTIYVLNRYWVTNFNFGKTLIFTFLASTFFLFWLLVRLRDQIKVNIIYPLIFLSVISLGLNYLVLNQKNELMETAFLIFGFNFVVFDITQKTIFSSLTKTILFAYLLLIASLASLALY